MSEIPASQDPIVFDKLLALRALKIDEQLGVKMPKTSLASVLFSYLIERCGRKFGGQVAVLTDEHDAPVRSLADNPAEAEKIRVLLREYYIQ